MDRNPYQTIPDEVIAKIIAHRPDLAPMARNLSAAGRSRGLTRGIEKRLCDAYLQGETRLTALETWHLSACTLGSSGPGYAHQGWHEETGR